MVVFYCFYLYNVHHNFQNNTLNTIHLCIYFYFSAYSAPVDSPECPEKDGVQAYAHTEHCDQFFLCTNGTLTLETCENGLLFDGKGNAHNHCNYNWAVDCKGRQWDRKFNPT